LPQQARLVANGVLLDAGRHAVVPASAVDGARQLWLRDGLGRTWAARVQQRLQSLPLAVLALESSPADVPSLQAAARDAFPGSPGYAVTYTANDTAAAAWPWLNVGFLGGVEPASGARRLGIEMPAHALPGSPVFDTAGRLVGLSAGAGLLLPVSSLRDELPALLPVPPATPPAASVATDELYERLLQITLQVIALR
jgi:hypothetical protein